MSRKGRGSGGLWLVGTCVIGALTMGACGGEPLPPDAGDIAAVQLALVQVPAGVSCISVTSTPAGQPAVEQKFPVAAGQASTMTITPLPAGLVTFDAKAYGIGCPNVTATSPVLWLGTPVSVLLGIGQTVPVTLTLRRAPSANVSVDFCTAQPCGAVKVLAVGGAPIRDLALGSGRVFFTDPSGIFSVPADGGDASPLVLLNLSSGIYDGAAYDATSIYTVRQHPDASINLIKTAMSNGADTQLTSMHVGSVPQVAGGVVYYMDPLRKAVFAMTPTAGSTPRIVFGETTTLQSIASNQPLIKPYIVDDVTIYYTVPGSIRTASISGQFGTVLYTSATGETVTAMASDGQFLYFGSRGSAGTLLKRIPLGGGTVETLANDTTFGGNNFAIMRIVVDSVAVYWTITQVPQTGVCTGVGLSARPFAGSTTPIQLFTTTTACGTDLVADASNLYLTAGRQVIRVSK